MEHSPDESDELSRDRRDGLVVRFVASADQPSVASVQPGLRSIDDGDGDDVAGLPASRLAQPRCNRRLVPVVPRRLDEDASEAQAPITQLTTWVAGGSYIKGSR